MIFLYKEKGDGPSVTNDKIFNYIQKCLEPTKDMNWEGDILWGDFNDGFNDGLAYTTEKTLHESIKDCENVCSGCTKIVIFLKNLPDYVVKIPLFGYHDIFDEEQSFCRAGKDFGRNCPKELLDAMRQSRNDYCGVEKCVYDFVETHYPDVAQCFCPIRKVGLLWGYIPVYVSDRVDSDAEDDYYNGNSFASGSKTFCDSRKKAESKGENNRMMSDDLKALFIDGWGDSIAKRFFEVVTKLGVPDIYDANIGVTYADHKAYLIDYAGFSDSDGVCYSDTSILE